MEISAAAGGQKKEITSMSHLTLANTGLTRFMGAVTALLIASFCLAVDLNGAGATFPYPLYAKWFDAYGDVNKNVRINYQAIGSGGGIKALKEGTVDFGASDAPLSDEAIKQMPGTVVHIPMVAGAVVLCYNLPGVGKGLHLTPAVIAGIFEGSITKWTDAKITALNPNMKLPNHAITVAHRSDGSGTSYIFTSYLTAVSGSWAKDVGRGTAVNWPTGIGGKGNDGVSGIVKQTPGGFGYVELAYAVQNKLPYAYIQNKAGAFVEPTIASTTTAAAGAIAAMKEDVRVSIVNAAGKSAYPIAGFTYILVYKHQADKAKWKALSGFLNWAIHYGQQFATKLLYAPLPAEVVKLNEAALKTIK